ncbi:SSU ribosomal protein S6P [Mycoplasmopsis mustelae]|uniref:Small ribosomal subunit protein bS6 n=1 Tax=Mycoplasmopsis mustelae TaxID=171289 RepID=A0A4R7UCE6_9BACT|nr:30S ribosomal protein S6 [Mycoplasmopsis mustelae]TDV24077.1 SSU ribosomal protein S6P [Mycoplasmopsis mustelae]
MNKYEIMMIVNPKVDVKVAFDLLSDVFGQGVKKAEKLDRHELAYEINKSKHAQYVLALVEANADSPKEFTRRVNITKEIWRTLVINLDSEKGLTPKKESKHLKPKRTFTKRETKPTDEADKFKKRPRVYKPAETEAK